MPNKCRKYKPGIAAPGTTVAPGGAMSNPLVRLLQKEVHQIQGMRCTAMKVKPQQVTSKLSN